MNGEKENTRKPKKQEGGWLFQLYKAAKENAFKKANVQDKDKKNNTNEQFPSKRVP